MMNAAVNPSLVPAPPTIFSNRMVTRSATFSLVPGREIWREKERLMHTVLMMKALPLAQWRSTVASSVHPLAAVQPTSSARLVWAWSLIHRLAHIRGENHRAQSELLPTKKAGTMHSEMDLLVYLLAQLLPRPTLAWVRRRRTALLPASRFIIQLQRGV